jgi:hypothetical protein
MNRGIAHSCPDYKANADLVYDLEMGKKRFVFDPLIG